MRNFIETITHSYLKTITLKKLIVLICTFMIFSCSKDEEVEIFENATLVNTEASIQAASRLASQSATVTTPYASFTAAQKVMADPFIDYVENMSYADLYNIDALVAPFEDQFENSLMSRTEKDGLLGLALAVKAMAKFIKNGGDEQIKEYLYFLGAIGGSPMPFATTNCRECPSKVPGHSGGGGGGCSVDFRSVWTSAVMGLVATGVAGGYAGATAGFFTLPILGTAGGAVGGAVYGAASGFVSGALFGVAGELLRTCGR